MTPNNKKSFNLGNYSSNSSSMNSLDLIDDEKSEPIAQNDEIQNYLNLKLDSKWSFYYLRNDRGLPDNSNWNDRLEYIATFETTGEFWATYQHIKLPSYLPQVSLTFINSVYHIQYTELIIFLGLRLHGIPRR